MKRLVLGAALVAAVGWFAPSEARAGVSVSINVGSPAYCPPVRYYAPPVAYCPPRVVYRRPARVVYVDPYCPPPVIIRPRPVVVYPHGHYGVGAGHHSGHYSTGGSAVYYSPRHVSGYYR